VSSRHDSRASPGPLQHCNPNFILLLFPVCIYRSPIMKFTLSFPAVLVAALSTSAQALSNAGPCWSLAETGQLTQPGAPVNTCACWYQANKGDTCFFIPEVMNMAHTNLNLTMESFIALNPQLSNNCQVNLWTNYSYCIAPNPIPGVIPTSSMGSTSLSSTLSTSTVTSSSAHAGFTGQAHYAPTA
jgi:hypothetical protein